MMKKPDRFERVVDKILGRDVTIYQHEVVDILRKEHAWMTQLVKNAAASVENGIEPGAERNGYLMACTELLSALNQRRK